MKQSTRYILAAAGAGLALWATRRKRKHRYSFRNRVVAITGGSRGFGLAMGRELMQEGAHLAILSRSPEELERAQLDLEQCGLGRVESYLCDVGDSENVQGVFRQIEDDFGGLDVLINNAGIMLCAPFENHEDSDFEASISTHLFGPLNTTRAALPLLRRRRGARILNISSIGGKIGVPHMSAYSAGKYALVGFSRSLAAELRNEDIRVTVVCPGLMQTGSHRAARFRGDQSGEFTWFSGLSATPLLSISAESAAKRAIGACRKGRAELVFPWHWRLAALGDSISPELSVKANELVERFLPDPVAGASEAQEGNVASEELSQKGYLKEVEQAAETLNQT